MTKRAYILTHHSVPNFGANLQAYATASALLFRGVDAKFVDFLPLELEEKYSRAVSIDQLRMHAEFAKVNLQLTRRVRTQAEFLDLCKESPADLYLSGSDAVFRLTPGASRSDLMFPNPYWLVGIPKGNDVVKAALAPSAMGCEFSLLSSSVRYGMRAALEDFDLISVRDSWTNQQINNIGIKRKIAEIPDPVFSLTPKIRKMVCDSNVVAPYIVVCTQGAKSTTWVRSFTQIAESHGFETLALPTPEGVVDEGTSRRVSLPIEPLEWMKIHAQSAGYVGGRFHPVVVSLCAGLPVVALDLYHRHPLKRSASKTWLIMRNFDCNNSCHSKLMHRFLSPKFVWSQLEKQQLGVGAKAKIADQMSMRVNDWFDLIVHRTKGLSE